MKKLIERFKAWRERRHWERLHFEYVRNMIMEDWRWLASVPVARELLDRYEQALRPDWYKIDGHEGQMDLRKRLNRIWAGRSPIEQFTSEDYAASYRFWGSIIPPGDKTGEQIARELTDYVFLLEQVPRIYDHVTGGKLTKTNYPASVVIAAADDYLTELVEREVKEAMIDAMEEPSQRLVIDMVFRGEEVTLLRQVIGDDSEPGDIRFQIGDGHSGRGVYVSHDEYPEEGSVYLGPVNSVTVEQKEDPATKRRQ